MVDHPPRPVEFEHGLHPTFHRREHEKESRRGSIDRRQDSFIMGRSVSPTHLIVD